MTREEKATRRDEMRAYKAEGHSFKDVAQKFGVSNGYAVQITKGIAPQKAKPGEWKNNQYTIIPAEERGKKYAEKYAPGFEYAGNYTGSEGTIDLRCKTCGSVITRATITIRKGHFRCNVCYAAEMARRKAQKAAEKETERAEKRRRAKEEKKRAKEEKEREPQIIRASQMAFAICEECGEVFLKNHGNQIYCSESCARKRLNRSHKDKRMAKLKTVIIDRDVDIIRLAKRDGGICYLCGKEVDWKDFETRENGAFIAGDMYPSIDHVLPLSKGGKQSWENVRLAHRRCNYLKSDNPPGR